MAAVRGYLVVTVAEASGRNKDEDEVWDPSFYEGFVKGAPHSPAVGPGTITSGTPRRTMVRIQSPLAGWLPPLM